MSTPEELTREIVETSELLAARVDANGAASVQRIATATATSLVHKIGNLPSVSTAQALNLQDAVHKCPFIPTSIEALLGAIDGALRNSCVAKSAQTSKAQQFIYPQNYMTQDVLDALIDPTTCPMRAEELVCALYRKLGIVNLHEQSKKWLVSILAFFESRRTLTFPSAWRLYDDVNRIQGTLAACATVDVAQSLPVYPQFPTDLPRAIYDQAYADGPPVTCDCPRIAIIANNHVPLRKSSKLLRGRREAEPHVSSPASLTSGREGNVLMDQLRQLVHDGSAARDRITYHDAPPHQGALFDRVTDASHEVGVRDFQRRPSTRGSPPSTRADDRFRRPHPRSSPQPLMDAGARSAFAAQLPAPQSPGYGGDRDHADSPCAAAEQHDPSPPSHQPAASHIETQSAQPTCKVPTDAELIENAALAALLGKKERKSDEDKQRKAEQKATEKREKEEQKASLQLPLAKRQKPTPPVMKKPAACLTRQGSKHIAMPDVATFPVDYNGGRIYASYPKKRFRIIRTDKVYTTECAAHWRAAEPTEESWKEALDAIDKARADEC